MYHSLYKHARLQPGQTVDEVLETALEAAAVSSTSRGFVYVSSGRFIDVVTKKSETSAVLDRMRCATSTIKPW